MGSIVTIISSPVAAFPMHADAQSKNKKPYIVFVVGDHEYGSELTMPLIAGELEKNFGMRTRVLTAYPNHESEKNIPGLEALDSADLAVFYLRWRLLPPEQNAYIDKYLKSGRPVVGFRTTTHAFNYPAANTQHQWNSFAEFAFGGPPGWGGKANHTHYGHESTTDVSVIKSAARHPILKGVASAFHVPSWLYKVLPDYPVKGTTWLLMGKSVNPNKKDAIENPVAWTWKTPAGGRSFMTTLGHPEDFQDESFQRLVFNAIHWALNKSAPQWKGKMSINVPYGKHATASNEIPKR
jgi:type 1 glutamine amidotransferase